MLDKLKEVLINNNISNPDEFLDYLMRTFSMQHISKEQEVVARNCIGGPKDFKSNIVEELSLSEEEIEKAIRSSRERDNLFNKINPHICIKQDSECSSNIIGAHALQNNRILDKIAIDGHVLEIGSKALQGLPKVELMKQSKNKATTFHGFCSYHDNKIFEPIESRDYIEGDIQQNFLFAYRAFARGYHTTLRNLIIFKKEFQQSGEQEIIDYEKYYKACLKDEDLERSTKHAKKYALQKRAFEKIEKQRIAMNINLDNRNYNKIHTDVIIFEQEYHMSVSGICTILTDLLGNDVNTIAINPLDFGDLYLTIFPQNGRTYVLLSYLSKHKTKFEFIKKQIMTKTEEEQKIILSNIIAMYCNEYFVVSPKRWEELSETKKEEFYKLVSQTTWVYPYQLVMNKQVDIFV